MTQKSDFSKSRPTASSEMQPEVRISRQTLRKILNKHNFECQHLIKTLGYTVYSLFCLFFRLLNYYCALLCNVQLHACCCSHRKLSRKLRSKPHASISALQGTSLIVWCADLDMSLIAHFLFAFIPTLLLCLLLPFFFFLQIANRQHK